LPIAPERRRHEATIAPMPDLTLDHLRRFAIARTLFPPTTLGRALLKLGFVQADPIRAPARAQDLTLRHRVKNYRAGDLERRYAQLAVEEDFFVNYGFLPRANSALMHPRASRKGWDAKTRRRAEDLRAFIAEHGAVHPRQVDEHFAHGQVTNYWGGTSNASTHLLDAMHYRGQLRVVRRDNGIRIYGLQQHGPVPSGEIARSRLDALVDLAVELYAPLPALSLSGLVSRLRWGAPQWTDQLRSAFKRAKERLAHARIDQVDWYWPATERPASARHARDERLRLLAPFDPLVWDRRRFELLWGWPYRFEAYTPAAKRKLGYYALPLLWQDQIIGWGNLTWRDGKLDPQLGFVAGRPREPAFERELEAELAHLRLFLG
jgi:uncharacterized protein YcaQ